MRTHLSGSTTRGWHSTRPGMPNPEARQHWIQGDATALPPLQVDLVTMTANVAQAIVDPLEWEGTLHGVYDALRPGGHFRLRDPACRAWREWNRAESYRITKIQGVGARPRTNTCLDGIAARGITG
jgi:SAM-dependent methyltransferase